MRGETKVVLPTSGGKTVCALAALINEQGHEITIIVVPYIALVEQVYLQRKVA